MTNIEKLKDHYQVLQDKYHNKPLMEYTKKDLVTSFEIMNAVMNEMLDNVNTLNKQIAEKQSNRIIVSQ